MDSYKGIAAKPSIRQLQEGQHYQLVDSAGCTASYNCSFTWNIDIYFPVLRCWLFVLSVADSLYHDKVREIFDSSSESRGLLLSSGADPGFFEGGWLGQNI